jgi:hypothetical protein
MIVSTERIKVMLLIKASLFRRGVEQALVGSKSIELSPVFDIDDVPYISKGSSDKVTAAGNRYYRLYR